MKIRKLLVYLTVVLLLISSCRKNEPVEQTQSVPTEEETAALVDTALSIYEETKIEERPVVSVIGDDSELYSLQFVYLEEEQGYCVESAPYYLGTLNIPSSVNGIPVVAIADYAFIANKSITALGPLPDTIRIIGKKAFAECTNLEGNLVLPSSVEEIGDYAFSETSLSGDLFLPDSLRTIGEGVFKMSDFDGDLVLGTNVESIGDYAFAYTSLKGDLAVPSNVKRIGDAAFRNTCFTSLMLTEGLETIGEYAFAYCTALEGDIYIPASVSSIDSTAFEGCRGIDGSYLITPQGFYKISV